MTKLTKSVGRGGANRAVDVKLVQRLLNQYKIPRVKVPLEVDGKAGSKTVKRIELFQKKILKMSNPDGRVDPDGKTFKKLTATRPGAKPAASFSLSTEAIDLLKAIEGLTTKPYDDQTGKDISRWVKGATIGYGHLITRRDWGKYKNGITRKQALALFEEDLAPYADKVKTSVIARIKQQEFDALVFLTFNIGLTAFGKSSVLKLVNNPVAKTPYTSLEKAWLAWNKSQGKYNRGLANRRKAEWNIYSKNVYEKW